MNFYILVTGHECLPFVIQMGNVADLARRKKMLEDTGFNCSKVRDTFGRPWKDLFD